MIITLTNYSDLVGMTRGRFEPPRGELLLKEMVAFCAAGLRAPSKRVEEGEEGD
jgi:hypothetical protein